MAKSLNYCKRSSRNRPYTRRYGARQRFPPFVPIGHSRCGACSGSTPGVRRDMWGDVADREKNRFCTPARSDRTRPIIISCPRPFSRFPFLCAFDTLIVPPRAYVSLPTSASSFQLPVSALSVTFRAFSLPRFLFVFLSLLFSRFPRIFFLKFKMPSSRVLTGIPIPRLASAVCHFSCRAYQKSDVPCFPRPRSSMTSERCVALKLFRRFLSDITHSTGPRHSRSRTIPIRVGSQPVYTSRIRSPASIKAKYTRCGSMSAVKSRNVSPPTIPAPLPDAVDPQFEAIAGWVFEVSKATALPRTLPDDNPEVHRLFQQFSGGRMPTVTAPSQVWDEHSNLVVEAVTDHHKYQPAVRGTRKSVWNRGDVERALEGKSQDFIDEFYRIDAEIRKFFSSPTARRLPSGTKSEC
jgi:hypothetical protein